MGYENGDEMDNECIFEYKSTVCYGCVGMPAGRSIGVYRNGDVVKRQYVIGDDAPQKETVLATVPELAKAIQDIINRHAEELAQIPNQLNNGTLDGSEDCFVFGNKTITAWTIQRTAPSEMEQCDEYRDNCIHENLVLDIYDEIARAINKRHVGTRLKIL